jgi:enoyl-CoA hydratase/carnithine racemase
VIQLHTDEILVEPNGAVLIITINRPQKLNSVTKPMSDALVAAVEWANDSDDVRCVVLTGAGDRAFCAGSDIRELDTYTSPWNFRNRTDYCDALRDLRKPVIAAVNGYAFGGGLETALSCDIRIASTSASFAASEVKLGWIGGGGMSSYLTQSIGPSNASLMLMTGDPIDAERAHAVGLVNRLAEPGEALAAARELAASVAANGPLAIAASKQVLSAAVDWTEAEAWERQGELAEQVFSSEDAREGATAFAEKRAPVWKGR